MEVRFDHDDNTYLYEFQKRLVNPSWRRLLLIIEIVENFFKRDDNKHVSAECYRLYSLSISEPAITKKEVEDFLDLAFADDRAFKIDALSNFQKLFPDIPNLTSPRSLKQLCRVEIRDCLPWSRPPLPSAVAQLELLPYYLKNYLLFLCDWIENSPASLSAFEKSVICIRLYALKFKKNPFVSTLSLAKF